MKITFLLLIISSFFISCTNINSFDGYKTHKTTHLTSSDSDIVELTHVKSGADIVLIKNSDPAKTFMIGFRTPPYDDTGLFHIFEHAVLAGSRLHPSKSNFLKVAASTVADFINAMTGPVFTVYPFITKSDKDFDNLLSVYMDAVLFPNAIKDPRIMKREGWRFEVDPKTKKMSINGIVLSEMKGAYSSPNRWVHHHLQKTMVPQTPYSYSSGGFPSKIASLTFEQIKDAHNKYYHPQNSVIILYGDIDYKKILSKIDKTFLANFTKQQDFKQPPIPLQTDFNYSKELVKKSYPGPALKNRDYLAKAFILGKTNSVEDTAYSILNQAFVTNDAAPLRLRILKEGVAKSVYYAGVGGEDNGIAFIFEGTSETQKDTLDRILTDELKKAAEKGIDPELLTSIINKYEFNEKENNSNGAKKGFQFVDKVFSHWLYPKESLIDSLDTVKKFKTVRKILANQDYVKDYFKKRLLENTHNQWIAIQPDPHFSEKFNKELSDVVKQALNEKSIDDYLKDYQDYQTWVTAEEPKEILDTIPTLKLSDIKPDAKAILFNKKELEGYTKIEYPLNTNGISYVRLYFDLSGLSVNELDDLHYFSSFLQDSNTQKYDFKQLSKAIDTYIGGLGFGASSYQSVKNPSQFKALFSIQLNFLNENTDKVFELLEEMTLHSEFGPARHLNDLYREFKSNMDTSSARRAPGLAYRAANGHFFPALNAIDSRLSGSAFERNVKTLNFDAKKLSPKLKLIAKKIFNKSQLRLVTITSSEADLPNIELTTQNYLNKVFEFNKDMELEKNTWPAIQDEYDGFIIPGEVTYTSLTTNYSKFNLDYSGAMKVYSQYLDDNFMIPQLREQLGAYGAWSSFSKSGLFSLQTYKDPNLSKSFELFSQIPSFMENIKITSKKDITPSILGSLKPYYSDQSVVDKSSLMTSLYLTEQTWDDYIQVKKEIINTTPEDFERITEVLKKAIPQGVKSAAGNKTKLMTEGNFLEKLMDLE